MRIRSGLTYVILALHLLAGCGPGTTTTMQPLSPPPEREEVPPLAAPADIAVEGLHDPIIATYVDETLDCEEVQVFARYPVMYAADLPPGTSSFTCYVEGFFNTGQLPQEGRDPEPYQVHVMYLPEDVSIQTHGYQAAIAAGAVDYVSRRPIVPSSSIARSDPSGAAGGFIQTEMRQSPGIVQHILPGVYAATWLESDGVELHLRSSHEGDVVLELARSAERGQPEGEERSVGG